MASDKVLYKAKDDTLINLSTKVINNTTSDSTTDALSARMGFELNNKINDLETNKLDKSDVVNSLTSTDSKKPLSSLQGNVLNTSISKLNDSKQNKPTISAVDLIAGTDSLTTGEFYFVYE